MHYQAQATFSNLQALTADAQPASRFCSDLADLSETRLFSETEEVAALRLALGARGVEFYRMISIDFSYLGVGCSS